MHVNHGPRRHESPRGPCGPRVKPYSEACERNQDPILAILEQTFADRRKVLEIGSGTGQHAVHFAANLPHLIWQPSDVLENLPGIELWRAEANPPNLLAGLELDVNQPQWPDTGADAAFTANTLHILSWPEVRCTLQGLGRLLPRDGMLVIYGPFNYGGKHTSQSNARFDLMLRGRDPRSGLRDLEAVDALAAEQGLILARDQAMPANNRILVWRRA